MAARNKALASIIGVALSMLVLAMICMEAQTRFALVSSSFGSCNAPIRSSFLHLDVCDGSHKEETEMSMKSGEIKNAGSSLKGKRISLQEEKCASVPSCVPLPPPHLIAAENLIEGLGKTRLNKYFDGCGELQRIKWGKTCAEAYVDSSTFVSLLLYHSAHWRAIDLEKYTGNVDPIAAEFYNAADEQQGPWQKILTAQDIKQGDFIFIKYIDREGGVSGHCMMIDGDLRPSQGVKNAPSGAVSYDVNVIDSAPKPHGASDTRSVNPGLFGPNGVGRGPIRLFFLNDKVVAYTWSTDAEDALKLVTKHPIVIARIADKPDFTFRSDLV